MTLGIILNTNDPETAWNVLRLAGNALNAGNKVSMFLLGKGVEVENIKSKTFDVAKALGSFIDAGGKLMACGTCLKLRHQEVKICPVSTMSNLVEMISESDKIVTFG